MDRVTTLKSLLLHLVSEGGERCRRSPSKGQRFSREMRGGGGFFRGKGKIMEIKKGKGFF